MNGWRCVLSTCQGRLQVVSTVGARTEGVWFVPGVACVVCQSQHRVTKHRTTLVSTGISV